MTRGSISLVIVSAIVLAGVVFLAPRILDRLLPEVAADLLQSVGSAASFGSAVPQPGDTPADFLDDSPEGLLATGPVAAHTGNQPVFITEVISGYRTEVSASMPAEITTIRPILGCLLTPPKAGTVVGYATSGQSGLALALTTYNDTHLADGVQAFVDDYRAKAAALPATGAGAASDSPASDVLASDILVSDVLVSDGPAYESYDVAVTETGAPVYLVLENSVGNRIWNLHVAPGAQIERVVLLGGDQAGVANLDPVVPVEVILNDGLAACGIQPAHAPNPGNAVFKPAQNADQSGVTGEATLAAMRDRAAAYDIWFRDSFGVLAGQSRVGFDKGTLSVIGPLPDAAGSRAVFASIDGARIRTTQDQYFEIKGQLAEGQGFAARVRAIATEFAFGDLANLRQGVDF